MDYSNDELISRVLAQDFRAISRLISLSENGSPRGRAVQAELFNRHKTSSHRAHVIGVTGSPGAGKSTLVDQLAKVLRADGKKVAIIAVDPSSPFTGGAILGDRIRMVNMTEDENVFIRSMATRGALGGLSRATYDAVQILETAGFEYILIETVGVGQAEVDIVRTADTCLVVLVPGMGDSVQAFKAGILEIADLFVINKADRDGVDLLHRDLRLLISVSEHEGDDWMPPILKSIAVNGTGAAEIIADTKKHGEWLRVSPKGQARRLLLMRGTLVKLASELVRESLMRDDPDHLKQFAQLCIDRRLEVAHAALSLLTARGWKGTL